MSPLLDWSDEDVWAYVRSRDVPYIALHDSRLPEHRLRAMHAGDPAGRGPRAGAGGGSAPRHVSAACNVRCVPCPRVSDHRGALMSSPRLDYLPLFLRINDQSAVVVGGGVVATRKTELLLRAGARVTVIAPELHAEMRQLLQQTATARLRHSAALFDAAHLDGARARDCGD